MFPHWLSGDPTLDSQSDKSNVIFVLSHDISSFNIDLLYKLDLKVKDRIVLVITNRSTNFITMKIRKESKGL